MLDLESAIKHCEEVAHEQDMKADFETDNQTYIMSEMERKRCRECADEHWQLAEWLRELKAYKESEWILCSERLPEERRWVGTREFGTTISDEVYVTFENPKGERFCKHLSFQNGKFGGYDQSHIDVWYKGSKPIAWKPLPEPYRGEQDES